MIAISIRHIKIVQHNIGNGITVPKLALTDDNTPVVVKVFNGPEGNLVLFNEYICYRLAVLLGIPMPISGICLIDNNTQVYNKCIEEDQYGYGFYSNYLNKSTVLVETIIPLISNKEVFYRILLFDHIVFNPDRNPGNLLVQYYKNRITLQVIDHTHVFINQSIWDAPCLERAIEEKDYFSTRILSDNAFLYSMFFRNMVVNKACFDDIKEEFQSVINEDCLRNIISEIPQEWIPPVRDIDALIKYIVYRVAHIDDIINTIVNYMNR